MLEVEGVGAVWVGVDVGGGADVSLRLRWRPLRPPPPPAAADADDLTFLCGLPELPEEDDEDELLSDECDDLPRPPALRGTGEAAATAMEPEETDSDDFDEVSDSDASTAAAARTRRSLLTRDDGDGAALNSVRPKVGARALEAFF
jgi:hypothetical protein